jgi:hypothetical protein
VLFNKLAAMGLSGTGRTEQEKSRHTLSTVPPCRLKTQAFQRHKGQSIHFADTDDAGKQLVRIRAETLLGGTQEGGLTGKWSYQLLNFITHLARISPEPFLLARTPCHHHGRSPSAVSKLLQRGRKDGLTEKLSGALFRGHG